MPKLLLTVPETVESVFRPVVLDVVRRICHNLGIVDPRIQYNSDLEVMPHLRSSIDYEGEDTMRTKSNQKVTIRAQETYKESTYLTQATTSPEHLFIFKDEALGLNIRPVYSATEVVLTFEYQAADRTQAIRWRDDIRQRLSQGRDVFLHDIKYHYLIPSPIWEVAKEVHRLRELVEPYGEDWDTYFNAHRTNRLHFLTGVNGENGRWGVAETQLRVQGHFEDFNGIPEQGDKDRSENTVTVSFDYRFYYEKPISCYLCYPLTVHNQFMPRKFRPDSVGEMPPYMLEQVPRTASMSVARLDYFESNYQQTLFLEKQGWQIPTMDEFVPNQIQPSTIRIYTCLIHIDPTQPTFLLNLNDVGLCEIDPTVLPLLKAEAPWLGRARESVFCLSLYLGKDMLADGFIQVDDDLNVYSTVPLSLRGVYHLRLSVYRDWTILSKTPLNPVRPPPHGAYQGGALDRMGQFPVATNKIIKVLDPWIRNPPKVIGGQYIPVKELERVAEEINDRPRRNNQIIQWNTVQIATIRTEKNGRRNT